MIRARTSTFAAACAIALALVGCATTPEEDPVLQSKLNDLDTRVSRIDRVVTNGSLLEISNQMETLRAELRSMHNDIDELNHALDTNRKQQRDLYADIDQRVKALEARAGVAPSTAGAGGAPGTAAGAVSAGAGAAAAGGAGAADTVSYQAAFALLKNGQYDQAIQAFQSFLATYPNSPLADNGQYWLGEAYYVNRSFSDALAAFQTVVDKYPSSRKVPDALLKIGYCDYELKQYQAAKDALTQVKSKYGDTSAGQLAQQRLEKMAAEKH
ncbi:MAG TPA: tol-pal system protein YbgF [Steroidobacteraceae bacterium]|jgi:tol-pal system protein YbgF|nr:tol-pal system protein YbgF [Steroidobacteraceae bacterium]